MRNLGAATRTLRTGFLGFLVACVIVIATPATTASQLTWIDTSDRDAVIDAFEAEYSNPIPDIGWIGGDLESCEAGISSQGYRRLTIRRVNYYRAMAGVVAGVVEDYGYSQLAHETAMMMSAQNELSHDPSPDYRCYSQDGHTGAANSNLYLGRSGPRAIDGYIEDPGDSNTDVGHRSTILHPPTKRMGVGNVAASDNGREANALWVFDDQVFGETNNEARPRVREDRRFVAWPPRGFVPRELVYPRWSITMADADFSEANVTMFRHFDEAPGLVALNVVDRVGAPGHVPLPAIVWEPEIDPSADEDTYYTVIVRDIKAPDGRSTIPPITYTVKVLGAEPANLRSTPDVLGAVGRINMSNL